MKSASSAVWYSLMSTAQVVCMEKRLTRPSRTCCARARHHPIGEVDHLDALRRSESVKVSPWTVSGTGRRRQIRHGLCPGGHRRTLAHRGLAEGKPRRRGTGRHNASILACYTPRRQPTLARRLKGSGCESHTVPPLSAGSRTPIRLSDTHDVRRAVTVRSGARTSGRAGSMGRRGRRPSIRESGDLVTGPSFTPRPAWPRRATRRRRSHDRPARRPSSRHDTRLRPDVIARAARAADDRRHRPRQRRRAPWCTPSCACAIRPVTTSRRI